MAELTDEQKIIIGVCVGVAALILIAIIIFICCTFYRKDKYRKRYHYNDRLPDYEYEKRPYTIYEDKYRPPPFEPVIEPLPPPLPPPEPRREIIYTRPRPEPPMFRYKYDYDNYSDYAPRQTRYEPERVYKQDPIVISYTEPEYSYSPPRREGETIYLKYNDDQALLRQTNYRRRLVPLRRSRSAYDIRRSTPYVGEWGRRDADIDDFNEGALRAGRDPFLWKSRR